MLYVDDTIAEVEQCNEPFPAVQGHDADERISTATAAEIDAAFSEPEQSPEEIEAEYQWWCKMESDRAQATLTEQLIERACGWGARYDATIGKAG